MKFPPKSFWQPIAISLGILVLFTASGMVVYSMYQSRQAGPAMKSGDIIQGVNLSPRMTDAARTDIAADRGKIAQNTSSLERLMSEIQAKDYEFERAGLLSPVAQVTLKHFLNERYFGSEVKKSPTGQSYLLPWARHGHLALPASFYERLTDRTNYFTDTDERPVLEIAMTSESAPYTAYLTFADSYQRDSIRDNVYPCFKTEEVDPALNPSGYETSVLCPVTSYSFKTKAYTDPWYQEYATSSIVIAPTSTVQFYDEILDRGMGNAEAYFNLTQGTAVERVVHISFVLKRDQTLTNAIKEKILSDVKAIQKSMAEESEKACAYDSYGGCY